MSGAALHAKNVFPSLTVSDITQSLQFYVDGLGFEIVQKEESEGVVRFAMLKAGNAMLGIGQDDFKKGRDRVKGTGIRFWIETEQDLTPLANRAKAAGVKLDNDPMPLPWGPIAFAVTDPDGYLITISAGM